MDGAVATRAPQKDWGNHLDLRNGKIAFWIGWIFPDFVKERGQLIRGWYQSRVPRLQSLMACNRFVYKRCDSARGHIDECDLRTTLQQLETGLSIMAVQLGVVVIYPDGDGRCRVYQLLFKNFFVAIELHFLLW